MWERYAQLTDKDLPVTLATGIPKSTLSSYKVQGRFPKGDELVDIAEFLGETAEYLVKGTRKTDDPWLREHRQLIEDLKMLPPEKLADQEEAIHAVAEKVRRDLGKASASGGAS